jgi:hypothetical protein
MSNCLMPTLFRLSCASAIMASFAALPGEKPPRILVSMVKEVRDGCSPMRPSEGP